MHSDQPKHGPDIKNERKRQIALDVRGRRRGRPRAFEARRSSHSSHRDVGDIIPSAVPSSLGLSTVRRRTCPFFRSFLPLARSKTSPRAPDSSTLAGCRNSNRRCWTELEPLETDWAADAGNASLGTFSAPRRRSRARGEETLSNALAVIPALCLIARSTSESLSRARRTRGPWCARGRLSPTREERRTTYSAYVESLSKKACRSGALERKPASELGRDPSRAMVDESGEWRAQLERARAACRSARAHTHCRYDGRAAEVDVNGGRASDRGTVWLPETPERLLARRRARPPVDLRRSACRIGLRGDAGAGRWAAMAMGDWPCAGHSVMAADYTRGATRDRRRAIGQRGLLPLGQGGGRPGGGGDGWARWIRISMGSMGDAGPADGFCRKLGEELAEGAIIGDYSTVHMARVPCGATTVGATGAERCRWAWRPDVACAGV
ncbi:hypothetical protein GY45DRAFT_1066533 [Cubamyces sp. BRFM 1775]|nr:hypothetical protein GY45DRAFT_1066533 [Cubamyces sp. BRFM 1775]